MDWNSPGQNMEWVAFPFSRGSSQPRDQTQVSRIAGGFFTSWATREQWHPTPVLLPGESHGRRSLVGCSPWGRWGSDTTERLHFHFSLSCIGEGNGNPLQCSCLENPRDGGAWWAGVSGVAQSWTRLKWLSSSREFITFISVYWRLSSWQYTCQEGNVAGLNSWTRV